MTFDDFQTYTSLLLVDCLFLVGIICRHVASVEMIR